MSTHTAPAAPRVPDAPAGWYLDERPTEGALVVPLGNTEADVAGALAAGWSPLVVVRYSRLTGRATARGADGHARPVSYSSRGGGGWRQGGRWVWFATPRAVLAPEPTGPDAAVPLADDEPKTAPTQTARAARPGLPAWLADAQREAARRDRARQTAEQARAAREAADERDAAEAAAREADQDAAEEAAFAAYLAGQRPETRPVWLYGAAADTEGTPTPEGTELADDAPDTTPRPALSAYEQARTASARRLREHEGTCARCCSGWSRCDHGARLARWAWDAQQAADGALATAR